MKGAADCGGFDVDATHHHARNHNACATIPAGLGPVLGREGGRLWNSVFFFCLLGHARFVWAVWGWEAWMPTDGIQEAAGRVGNIFKGY